jgi:drug/metabolite transporter (DMT)-like permease
VETFWLTGSALLCFAANSILCRLAIQDGAIDPASFTTVRLMAGALLLAALRWRTPGPARRACVPGLLLFVYAGAFSFAYAEIPAATGALVLFAAVQATMLAGGLSRGERLEAREGSGLLLASLGLGYLLSPGVQAPPMVPALLMIGAGAAWGLYSLSGRGARDPLEATRESFLVAAPLSLALSVLNLRNARLSFEGVALALASGALASGMGYVLWHHALKRLTAARAAAAQLAVPVLAALGGIVLLSETPSLRLLLSSVAVLGGIGLTVRARLPERTSDTLASSGSHP